MTRMLCCYKSSIKSQKFFAILLNIPKNFCDFIKNFSTRIIRSKILNRHLKNACFLLLFVFVLTGCRVQSKISAFSDSITRESLASYNVGTPDPCLIAPPAGKRIYVQWNLPNYHEYSHWMFKLRVRFGDRTERVVEKEITKKSGTYTHSILNECYFSHNGVLTYKVELFGDDLLIDEWRHQMWVELITFEEVEY